MFSKATKQVFLDTAHRELKKGTPYDDACDRAQRAAEADHQRRAQADRQRRTQGGTR